LHLQRDFRRLAAHARHPVENQPLPQTHLRAQRQHRAVALRQRQLLLRLLPQALDAFGVAAKPLPGRGQFDAGSPAREQRPAEPFFHRLDPPADR